MRGILLVLGQGFWQKDEVLIPSPTGGTLKRKRIRRNYSHYAARRPGIQARKSPSADGADPTMLNSQRAGVAPPHAEGDGLSRVASDGELYGFISVPASFVGGVPVTLAMNPWAMPEASV